jgi:chemotaxis protein methyltransferase CheR
MTQKADTRGPGAKQLVDGEFLFTDEDFRRICAMLHADAGIAIPDTKATLVYSRLAKRLRTLGLSSFRDYCSLLGDRSGAGERQTMMAALTTNVTRFFREPHHFEHLETQVLPPLLARAKNGGRVRIWSAGCSSGMEPYSIALTILGALPNAADLDIRVLASDIDPNMVAIGRAGLYADDIVEPIPVAMRRRWMSQTREGQGWAMGEEARALVAFRELNLIGAWPMKGSFDVIFCRNTVIYFEENTQSQVWSRFAPMLAIGGSLYIGHSERLTGPAVSQFVSNGLTTYRRTGGPA